MRISIENNGMLVSIDVDAHPNKNQALKLFGSMYDMYMDFTHDSENKCNVEPAQEAKEFKPIPVPAAVPYKDDFNIRQRLPNNLVDVKDLDIKQAVTQKALVRCPECGQAHCLAVSSGSKVYLMERDMEHDEFNIIAEFDSLNSEEFVDVCCKPDTDRLAYFKDLQNAEMMDHRDFTADNDTEVFCPVCCKSSKFFDWKKAFEEPLNYFETTELCDVCGGETVVKMHKKNKIVQCECCGYKTDYKEE